jgi:hypothetical protein
MDLQKVYVKNDLLACLVRLYIHNFDFVNLEGWPLQAAGRYSVGFALVLLLSTT